MSNKIQFLIFLFLIFLGIFSRFLPHPPNFSPVLALVIFSAILLPRKMVLVLPFLIMFFSDIFLGFYNFPVILSVYLSLFLISFLALLLKNKEKGEIVLLGALFGSLIFFCITNFAVWAFTPWYQKTFSGLFLCFFNAVPFFKNTLLGNFFYSFSFFGLYEVYFVMSRFYFKKNEAKDNII